MEWIKYRPVWNEADDLLCVPKWCLFDTNTRIVEEYDDYIVTDTDYDSYRYQRRQSYYACNWYPYLVDNNIPTIESVITTFDQLEKVFDTRNGPKFVRGCCASPKDVCADAPIFYNATDAKLALLQSERTKSEMCHVMLRDVVTIEIECRCFVHKHKLRAISIYVYLEEEEKNTFVDKIIEFFDLYGNKLPYNSAVVEMATVAESDFPLIIEFNSFGVDQYAGSSRFDWFLDKDILYNSEVPVVRMPNEYDWT